MPPIGVFGVVKAKLIGRRLGDAHAKAGDVMRLIRRQRKPQRLRVDEDETVATISCIDGKGAQALDL